MTLARIIIIDYKIHQLNVLVNCQQFNNLNTILKINKNNILEKLN